MSAIYGLQSDVQSLVRSLVSGVSNGIYTQKQAIKEFKKTTGEWENEAKQVGDWPIIGSDFKALIKKGLAQIE